ncbi:hypothetical protein, partial [Jatrophihabitans endophyticus]|uniref:hypothetical protein n=1 Tax=Jatrophihabitans endophyticus TaxID=1206085 RepID=UPI001A0DECE5
DLAHELEARLAIDDGAHGRDQELDELFMTPRGDAPDSDDEPAEPASPSRPPRSDRGVGAQ